MFGANKVVKTSCAGCKAEFVPYETPMLPQPNRKGPKIRGHQA